jgi:hypothetical protein
MAEITGLIWATSAYNMSGYSSVARNFLLGIAKTGFPIRLLELGSNDRMLPIEVQNILNNLQLTDVGDNPALVIHTVPDYYRGIGYKHIQYKILCTIFETHRIPKHWVPICNSFDEVWVPSEFNRISFSETGVDKNKISVFPYGINLEMYKDNGMKINIPNRKKFTFLYICEFTFRKGIDTLFDAFTAEFTPDEDVSLILKISFPGIKQITNGEARDKLKSYYPNNNWFDTHGSNIILLLDSFTHEELTSLINSIDVYISTDRANGYGMPCLESMALGKPTATIDWSGSTQFMHEDNSLLIKAEEELEDVHPNLIFEPLFLYKNQKWAKVNINNVRQVMRYSFENYELAKEYGVRAHNYLKGHLTDVIVGTQIVNQIKTVDVKRPTGNPKVYKKSKTIGVFLNKYKIYRKSRNIITYLFIDLSVLLKQIFILKKDKQ